MPLAYADDVDILGRIDREVAVAFSKFAEESRSIGLAVNESKKKYLLSTAKDSSIGKSVEIDGYNFEVVKDFVYLGSSINTDMTSVWKSDVGLLLKVLWKRVLKNDLSRSHCRSFYMAQRPRR